MAALVSISSLMASSIASPSRIEGAVDDAAHIALERVALGESVALVALGESVANMRGDASGDR
jgi:hypothetical protein